MTPQAWAATAVVALSTVLFIWLVASVIRAERRASRRRWAEYNTLKAAFDALPKPKDHI